MEGLVTLIILFVIIAISSIRQIDQYERGILFRRGKYTKVLEPGWHIIWPIFESCKKIDIRTRAVEINWEQSLEFIFYGSAAVSGCQHNAIAVDKRLVFCRLSGTAA